ncbi:Aldo/keto reductase [Mycena polygramma]|nr:Aldo/keto reductase [Mycena polygramma]
MSALTIASTVRLSSGFDMPLLGFGVYENYDAKTSVLEAFKVGYRHIDTAQAYRNEAAVGAAIQESGLRREELFITTKCLSNTKCDEETLKGVVDASLTRLNLDYVDLFLIHDAYSGKESRLAIYKALLDAKQAGKVRSVGVSNFGVAHLNEIVASGLELPSVNQIELHPFCQQKEIVDWCKNPEHPVVVQAYCPIIRGKEGKMDHTVIKKIAKPDKSEPDKSDSITSDSIQLRRRKCDCAQILLRWSLQKGFVPLPKSAQTDRIHSNAQLYDFELSEGEMSELDALDLEEHIAWNSTRAP